MEIRLHTESPEKPEGKIFAYQLAPEVAAGQSLAQALWLAPETAGWLRPPSLCSGLGRCGRCRVLFLSIAPQPVTVEQEVLTPQELAAGWRLACTHTLQELAAIALGGPSLPGESSESGEAGTLELFVPPPPLPRRKFTNTAASSLALAVDVGTTSLHWRALDLDRKNPAGTVVAEGREINPQMGAGADVMSRLAHAQEPQGRAQLAHRLTCALKHICAALPAPVAQMCLAANSAMTCILLQKDCAGLAAAPYHCDYAGNSCEHLPGLPPAYIPPLPSPFVGADISAGMAFIQHAYGSGDENSQLNYPFLLADMGTNGEFVLALSPRKAYLTSIPLGPALEGMALTFGGMAGAGAQGRIIHRFSLLPTGLTPHFLPESESEDRPEQSSEHSTSEGPRICATGYLSLLHILLRLGLLGAEGNFCAELPAHQSPLSQRLARQLYQAQTVTRLAQTETRLALNADKSLYLRGHDVEEILKVKAAFSLAFERLLQSAQLQAADLRHIFLAGAFGEHVIPEDLEALGFLPTGAGARVRAVGNSALEGAALLLQKPELRAPLARWSTACTVLDLTADPNFTATYMRHMRFA